MKKLIPIFLLGLLVTACTQGFHERQLRGTYKLDMRAIFQNGSTETNENDIFAGLAELIGGSLDLKVEFEGDGKARIHLGLGLLEGLINAFGGEDAEISGGASIPMRWKVEGKEIYIAQEGEDFDLLGRVIDFRGYDEITLEVDQEGGEPLEITMVRLDEEE